MLAQTKYCDLVRLNLKNKCQKTNKILNSIDFRSIMISFSCTEIQTRVRAQKFYDVDLRVKLLLLLFEFTCKFSNEIDQAPDHLSASSLLLAHSLFVLLLTLFDVRASLIQFIMKKIKFIPSILNGTLKLCVSSSSVD